MGEAQAQSSDPPSPGVEDWAWTPGPFRTHGCAVSGLWGGGVEEHKPVSGNILRGQTREMPRGVCQKDLVPACLACIGLMCLPQCLCPR